MREYKNYEDFVQNYKITAPDNFNFAFDVVDELANSEPDRRALIWANDEGDRQVYSFLDMKQKSDAVAIYLEEMGIKKGDRVMLILRRRIEYWFCILALMKIGAIAIPATHHLNTSDIVYRNNAAGVKAIITTDDKYLLESIYLSQERSPGLEHIIRLGGEIREDVAEKIVAAFDSLDIALNSSANANTNTNTNAAITLTRTTVNEDPMLLYFTSGTTGMPKMVLHNYIYPLGHVTTAKYWHNLSENSIHLTLSDTGWAKAAWGKLYGQWLCKATIMVYEHDKLVPSKLLNMMAENQVTSFCAPPTVYKLLINANMKKYDISALSYATSAGEPLNEDVWDKFKELTGLEIYEAYGQTETTPIIMTTKYSKPKPGSIGLKNPFYEVLFLDREGKEVKPGEPGEICVRCEPGDMGVFMGYFGNESKMQEVFLDGIYHTGDLAIMDESGYVFFVGRSDDIIKSAGYRIGPFEVESVVQEHESVLECAVTGEPDKLRGQNIKVSIILNEGFVPDEKLKREIKAFVKANAASYKIPRIIEFVDELPKTISGKVRRTELRKQSANSANGGRK